MTSEPEVEILRTGSFVGVGGVPVVIGTTELADIAASYDATRDPAPIVIGHPSANGPAYGWVSALRIVGDRLRATIGRLDPGFRDVVRAGRYAKISASLYRPGTTESPRPGRWYLRHVGFLGAHPPAVKGLAPAMLAEGVSATPIDPVALAGLANAYADRMAAAGMKITAAEAVRRVIKGA